ncbi:hypothetical protein [Rhizobium sp. BR 314]|uniref:hypothetical protein n=1 Tax=Rhizobium sp. BR 314 TaxID=3040013 RepID=UPI0039BF88FF
MVSAISSSSTAAATTNSSSSAATEAQLKVTIKEKNRELDKATDEKTRAALQKQITKLQAQLQKLQNADKAKSTAGADEQNHASTATLSGESDRIGSKNFDSATDFGQREAYV